MKIIFINRFFYPHISATSGTKSERDHHPRFRARIAGRAPQPSRRRRGAPRYRF